MAYTTNQERLSSSVTRRIMETLRENAELREVLGEAVRPEPVWWLNGDPYIHGAVSLTFVSFDSSLLSAFASSPQFVRREERCG